MIYVAGSLVAIWLGGGLVFAAYALNDMRVIFNNFAQGRSPSNSGAAGGFIGFGAGFSLRATAVNPDHLNEVGREHLRKAIRHERMWYVWAIGGFILIVCAFTYAKAQGSDT
jgi:hypothetical protein